MVKPTVRNLPDEVEPAPRLQATQHGSSAVAEVHQMLEPAGSPEGQVKLGSLLADMGRRAKLSDEEFAVFEQVRSKASPADLS